jgi:hypothetical protein
MQKNIETILILPSLNIKKLKIIQAKFEYMFKASPSIIYLFVTQPTCLVRWFCDEVDNVGDAYTFSWNGEEEEASLTEDIEEELVKFVWEDRPEEFLQFRIYKTDITNETILEVTECCEEDEVKSQNDIWDMNIKKLKIACGG